MKTYPSIEHSAKAPQQPCYVFVKYDGSNIRAEWSKKRGWYKFGTRTQLLDESTPIFGTAIPLFLQKYGDDLPKVFKADSQFRGADTVTVFAEWFGAKSFAGRHLPEDSKDIVLFDVNPLKKGFLGPKRFVDTFGHLKVAEVLEISEMSPELVDRVRSGQLIVESKYDVRAEVPEGVICKGGDGHAIWMAKIKTQRYYEELKARHPIDWQSLWE
jgi:hypothetical protein